MIEVAAAIIRSEEKILICQRARRNFLVERSSLEKMANSVSCENAKKS